MQISICEYRFPNIDFPISISQYRFSIREYRFPEDCWANLDLWVSITEAEKGHSPRAFPMDIFHLHFQYGAFPIRLVRARAIKVPYPVPTVRMVDMATAKLNVLMGILAYCVGQSTAIRPPPALLQGVGRDQLITLYFWEGFQYKAIICFLYFVHGIALSLRQLKRILKRLHLRRRPRASLRGSLIRHLLQVRQYPRHFLLCWLVSAHQKCLHSCYCTIPPRNCNCNMVYYYVWWEITCASTKDEFVLQVIDCCVCHRFGNPCICMA